MCKLEANSYMSCFTAQSCIDLTLCLFRASGDMKGGIVVEMKSGEKGNEESGLLNKPNADQVRRHRHSRVYRRVQLQ